jgi:hypothetical protein
MILTAPKRTVALIAAIAVLLPSLAILQYQWLGELSGLEQVRAEQNLDGGTVRLSTEFDSQLSRLYSSLSAIDLSGAADAGAAVRIKRDTLTPAGFVKELRLVTRKDVDAANPAWMATVPSRTVLYEVPAIAVPDRSHKDRWIVAMLDMDNIANNVIPTMLAGCFEGGIPSALDVMIIRDDVPDMAVYRSRPDLRRDEFSSRVSGIP